MSELILEGGKAVDGRRILQSEVPLIIDKVDEILSGLGLVKGEDWDMVGSAGKKKEEDTSGDIDVCIKRDRMKEVLGSGDGKNDVFNDLGKYLMELGYDKQHVSFDQVSCGIPINDADDIIQVDFILTRSLEWSRFTQSSPDYRKDESKYKAHVRNVLMMCIVKYCFKRTTKKVTLDDDTIVDGEAEVYVIRLTDGLYKTRKNWLGKRDPILKHAQLMREYDELITDTPQDFINLIFEDGVTVDDFLSFETLFNAFMSDKFKFPENRERILVGYVMSLDSNNPPIDIPSEIPQEYVDKAREKERLAAERDAYNKEHKIKRTIKHIETFESFAVRDEEVLDINEMKNIISFEKFISQNTISLNEEVERNTTNTPEDILYMEIVYSGDELYVDGYIKKPTGRLDKHPLAVALYIPPTMWKSLGMSYKKWLSEMFAFEDDIIEETERVIDVNNPPSGFFELISFEKKRNVMWISIDDNNIPFPSYLHKLMFEPGGELYKIPPTNPRAQKYIQVLRIGNYI